MPSTNRTGLVGEDDAADLTIDSQEPGHHAKYVDIMESLHAPQASRHRTGQRPTPTRAHPPHCGCPQPL
jgi:hypothetical protein